jgi:hypothetical protein
LYVNVRLSKWTQYILVEAGGGFAALERRAERA